MTILEVVKSKKDGNLLNYGFGNGLTDGWMDIEGCRTAFETEFNETKSL